MAVEELSEEFGLPYEEAVAWLKTLDIPTLGMRGTLYFNLFAFEKTLFGALMPGQPDRSLDSGAAPSTPYLLRDLECAALSYSVCERAALRRKLREWKKVMKQELKGGRKG